MKKHFFDVKKLHKSEEFPNFVNLKQRPVGWGLNSSTMLKTQEFV